MRLKILHLLSNWKWTEISEPAVELALSQKRFGAVIEFVCGRDPMAGSELGVEYNARLKGLDPVHVLDMPKHLKVRPAFKDFLGLRPMLKRFNPDVIHCHKSNAHLMGFLVKGFAKLPIIVRSCYDPGGLPRGLRAGMLYRFGTDGLVVISEKSKKLALAKNGFPSHAVKVVEPGIDLDRFSPARRIPVDEGEFGLGQGSFVIGIVTRIRANRRLDIVFRALQTLAPSYPQMRILLVGRGREGALEKVVEVPTREMGIFEKVAIAGYCGGDRLVAAYRAMDVLVYPTPGSDKSCRTVREAMAAGVPVIAPRIGFLPDLIDDRITGRIMDSSQESLVQILSELMQDNAELHAMGRRSLETSNRRFAPEMQAEKTLTFYENILKRWQ